MADLADLADGETAEAPGSGGRTYTLKNTGGVYSCSCPAWQFQGAPIERRSCKHLRAYRGDEAETARVGAAAAPRRPATRTSSGGSASGSGASASATGASSGVAPKVLLAQRWDSVQDVSSWWISEKLDGVRAYWDGERFISRQGNVYWAPAWFIEGLPPEPLDGELWVGRKRFQQTVSIVRRQDESDQWKDVRYLVFDAPACEGGFEARHAYLEQLFTDNAPPYALLVAQQRCRDLDHLREELAHVEGLGGEGLMLRQPGSRYVPGRSTTLLKVKTFHDAEARVVDHLPGTGKHSGRLGALRAELPDGTLFSVGTGLSDAEREDPPAIGALITFRYQELTDGGVPRFPSFVGARHDLSWEQVQWPPAEQGRPAAAPRAAAAGASAHRATSDVNAPVADLSHVAPSEPVEEVSRQLMWEAGSTQRFWEVEQDGSSLTITSGRIGKDPKVETLTFRSARQAAERAEKLAQAKIDKGYEEY
jgi:DNA ligase-1